MPEVRIQKQETTAQSADQTFTFEKIMALQPLAEHFGENVQDMDVQETLRGLLTYIPNATDISSLQFVRQLESRLSPPPMGVSRLSRISNYLKVRGQINRLRSEAETYEIGGY